MFSKSLSRKIKNFVRENSYHLPRVRLLRYLCDVYLDAYYGNTNASFSFNGEKEFLRQSVSGITNGIVFDVGANIGAWTREALRINPSIVVHCFEPSETTFSQLVKNVPPNVVCKKLALGSRVETRIFYSYGSGSVHNSLFFHEGFQAVNKEEVSVDTIDNYCSQEGISQIEFLKIDVEGAELEVLRGAKNLLLNRGIGIIQFEYGNKWIDARIFLKDMYEFLEEFGYHIWKLIPGGKLRPILHYDYTYEQFRHSTFILTAPK